MGQNKPKGRGDRRNQQSQQVQKGQRGQGGQQGQQGQQKKPDMNSATQQIKSLGSGRLKEWKTENLVESADGIGKELRRRGMTTSQIRNFLDEVNRLDAQARGKKGEFDRSQVLLLKPLLAYAAGRERGNAHDMLSSFHDLFSEAADRVEDPEDFEKFVNFTRAVVAYHRYHGGNQ